MDYTASTPRRRSGVGESALDKRVRRLEKELETVQRLLEARASYGEDRFYDGAVLVFDRVFDRTTYHYAAVRAKGLWYVTGPTSSGKARTWDELTEWLASGTPAELFEVTEAVEVTA